MGRQEAPPPLHDLGVRPRRPLCPLRSSTPASWLLCFPPRDLVLAHPQRCLEHSAQNLIGLAASHIIPTPENGPVRMAPQVN